MAIVATSVWIDFFHGKDTVEVGTPDRFLAEGEDIRICGIILTEVLQSIRENSGYARTFFRLDASLFLEMNRRTFVKAAQIHRTLRRRSTTISEIVAWLIAASAIENKIHLLHGDRDFDPIEKCLGLKAVKVA